MTRYVFSSNGPTVTDWNFMTAPPSYSVSATPGDVFVRISIRHGLEILLDGNRGGGRVADGGRHLTRELRADVARGEEPAHARVHVRVGLQVAHVVVVDVSFDDAGVGPEADEHEHRLRGQLARRVRLDVAQNELVHEPLLVRLHLFDDAVPDHFDLGI